jgi:hypothetical protein
MRILYTALCVLFFTLLPWASSAQESDYTIHFKSGKFTPAPNIDVITLDSSMFRNSLFQSKHYVVVQLEQLPNSNLMNRLQSAGIVLHEFLSGNAYIAIIPANINISSLRSLPIRAIFQLSQDQKSSAEIRSRQYPLHAIREAGTVDVNVVTYQLLQMHELMSELSISGVSVLEEQPMFRTVVLRVPQTNISELVKLPWVQWVEPIDPPNQAENLLGRTLHNVNVLNDGARNLNGDGVKVGVWDGGEIDKHLDFSGTGRLIFLEKGSTSAHGTHVGGTVGGAGLINPKARGMAPNTTIYSSDFSIGSTTTEIFNAVSQHGLSISSHSYGGSVVSCAITGSQLAYSATSRNTDITLNTFPSHLHVHSAGNSQGSCTGGFYTITGSGKSAKNNVVVANIQSSDAISTSSSFGPVHDGRIKPEISAFGTGVLSTVTPNNAYATYSGTSMATPGVSGTLALLVQRYRQLKGNADPLSSLMKAVICNTATDLGNPAPDYKFGFGKINALAAVRTLEEERYQVNTIAQSEIKTVNVIVPAGATRLKAMITWNDPAAASNSSVALVNNLNLSVINGAAVTLPWVLNGASPGTTATRGVDNVNNIEQVTIDNPAAGTYTLSVDGIAIAVGASQQYTITWMVEMPSIEVTYPNGGESFDPADAETISWTNSGVTTNQTVEYSIDNGATWNVISSTVAAATTRLVWTVPNVNASQAKIRVSSGVLSDQSDNGFYILGTPKNLVKEETACVAGSVKLNWDPVASATHYDVLRLNATTAQWEVLVTNLTISDAVVTGLTGGTNYWFSIRAKNNTNGSVSERAIAISAIAPTGNLSAPGSITGASASCSNNKGVVYSITAVSGATSYIWKVPAGATIVNGQGTTSILVDFGATAVTGIIAVYTSNGVCRTNTSEFAVTITAGPALAVTPVNPAICAPASVNLTASAPGSAGTSYTWAPATGLSSTSGPTVTANPSQTTTYTVTATNPDGCVATTNTTVYVGNASNAISSNSPVCEGGTLRLAASPAISNKYASLKITEVVQFKDGSGGTLVYPFYVPAPTNAEDMLELSNLDGQNEVDMSGVVFELWTGTAMNRSFTVPNGVVLPPNQTMVIFVGSAGADNPLFRFYRTGGTNNPLLSSSAAGWLLKSPAASIIDVVATNSYVWPAASGVTATHWTGNLGASTNLAGAIRTVATDNNLASDWTIASTSLLQTIGTYNGGYTSVSPYSWSGPGGFTSAAQNPVRINVTAAMAGQYTVTYTGGDNGCTATQATLVTINPGPAPIVAATANFPVCVGSNLNLSASSTGAGSTYQWTGPNGFSSSSQTPTLPSIGYPQAGTYAVSVTSGGCTETATVSVPLKQLSGTYRIAPGSDYNSITEIISDYNNASCIQGPVIIELQSNYDPSYESFPIIIRNSPGASAVNILTIRPATGTNPQVISSINGSSVIRFDGARFVTIDGRAGGSETGSSMVVENLSTSALAGTGAISFINGAQFNTINYVKALNGTTNGSQTAANIIFGTTSTVGNSNNTVSNSFFAGSQETQTQMRYGLISDGSNALPNNSNTISGNEFYSAVFRSIALNAGLGNSWQILNNHVYWHGGSFSTSGHRPLLMNNTASSGHNISGNFIGGNQPNALGSWTINTSGATTWNGMDLNLGTNAVTQISNNIIRNVSITSTATGFAVSGLAVANGSYNISGNTISDISLSSTGANPVMTGIYHLNPAATSLVEISSNRIHNLNNSAATANPSNVHGIYSTVGANGQLAIRKNKIYKLYVPGSTAAAAQINGISLSGSNSNDVIRVENNMISLGFDETNAVNLFGIQNLSRANELNVFFNTVVLGGTTSGSKTSAAFSRNAVNTPVNVRNNILYNLRTGNANNYAISNTNTDPAAGWTASGYNNLYSADPATIALWNATPNDLATYKANASDVSSKSFAMFFVNSGNGDLHLAGSSITDQNLRATAISGITTDIDDEARSVNPYMGADEVPMTPLPVGVEYFTGRRQDNKHLLAWRLTCNSSRITMEVERSADGRNFTTIGTVSAVQAQCAHPFDFTDANPLSGINYYRLKTMDDNGTLKYSIVIALSNKQHGFELVGLYPTLVHSTAALSITATAKTSMEITITDALGRMIQKKQMVVAEGSTIVGVDFSNLSSGVYQLTGTTTSGYQKTIRFTKQ